MIYFYALIVMLLIFVSGFHTCEFLNTPKVDRQTSKLVLILVDITLSLLLMISIFEQVKIPS